MTALLIRPPGHRTEEVVGGHAPPSSGPPVSSDSHPLLLPTTDLWQSVAEGQRPAGVCTHTHTHTHTQLCCSLFLCWAGDHEPKTIKSFQNQQTANTGEFRKVVLSSCLSVLQRDTVVIPGAGTRLYSNNALKDKIQNEIYTFSSTPVATISVQMSIIHSCYCDNKPKHQYWTTIIHLNRMYSSVTADA